MGGDASSIVSGLSPIGGDKAGEGWLAVSEYGKRHSRIGRGGRSGGAAAGFGEGVEGDGEDDDNSDDDLLDVGGDVHQH